MRKKLSRRNLIKTMLLISGGTLAACVQSTTETAESTIQATADKPQSNVSSPTVQMPTSTSTSTATPTLTLTSTPTRTPLSHGTFTFVDGDGGDVFTAEDMVMSSAWPEFRNGGAHGDFQFAGNQHSMLRFNCSSIPANATCLDATLYLYHSYGPEGGGTVIITAYSVAAANARWNAGTKDIKPAGAGESCWQALACDGNGGVAVPWAGSEGCSTREVDYESTEIGSFLFNAGSAMGTEFTVNLNATRVQGWFAESNSNYGLILMPGSPSGHAAQSNHGTETYRPKLVVRYSI